MYPLLRFLSIDKHERSWGQRLPTSGGLGACHECRQHGQNGEIQDVRGIASM
jgi:hypothetical protein